MIDENQLFENLKVLNHFESIGQYYYQTYQKLMDYSQAYILMKNLHVTNPLEFLQTKAAQLEQKEILDHYWSIYHATGLTEKDFILEIHNIEMEQLPRYLLFPRHKHNFFEFVNVLSGECTHIIGDHHSVHHAGDFTIIPPDVEHELIATTDCVCITTKVRSSAFFDAFPDLIQTNSKFSVYFSQVLALPYYRCALTLHSNDDSFVKRTVLNMYGQQMEGLVYSDVIIEHTWVVLFSYLLQNYQDSAEYLAFNSVKNRKTVELLNYIYENYQTITLAETAKHFYLTVPHLSAKIRKLTGKTFTELVREYKLQQGADLLLQTNKKLNYICDEIGYKDTAQFTRTFKEYYNMTPSQYRKLHKQTK